MDVASQRKMSGAISRPALARGQIAALLGTLALLASAGTWMVVAGPTRDHAPAVGVAVSVSDPVNVEFRRGEREGLGAGSGSSVSDPVNVEFRRGERQSLGGSSVNSVSDPVNVEFRRGERIGS